MVKVNTSVNKCLMVMGTAAMVFCAAGAHAQTAAPASATSAAPAGSITDMTVFHVKPARLDDFMKAMRANIAHSRTEDGNVSFNAYSTDSKPGTKAVTVYVLETWKNADVQKQHSKQATLVALHKTFPTDLVTHPESSAVQEIAP